MLRAVKFASGLLAASLVAICAQGVQADDSVGWKSVKERGVLRCGVALSPPYTMRDPQRDTYGGVFPVLCQQFGEQVLKVKVEFVDTTWDNIVAGLQSGKWDLSLSLNDTPERRKAIAFSKPVVDYSVNFTFNERNGRIKAPIATLQDLDQPQYSVAVMSGTVQDKAISGVLKQARIVRLPGFDETRMSLMSKRVDFLADDTMTNQLLVTAHPDWAKAFTPTPQLAPQGINFGIAKQTPQADIDELDHFIAQQTESGAIAALVKTSVEQAVATAH